MEKILKDWHPLTISRESSILDIRLCSEYVSEFSCKQSLGWRRTHIPDTHENSTKNQSVTEWYWCGRSGAMDKNVDCLPCQKVEAIEYFELLDVRYGDMNAVTQRV